MLSEDLTKGIVSIALFISTFGCSLVPIKFRYGIQLHAYTNDRYHAVISILNCFAAGVFLATCLLDLFPEVQDKMSTALEAYHVTTSFPVAEFTLSFGLFIILFIEQTALTYKTKEDTTFHQESSYKAISPSNHQISINGGDLADEQRPLLHDNSLDVSIRSTYSHDSIVHEDSTDHNTFRSLLLLLALSLHSVFEGLAVGLQATSEDVLEIFAALALHKCILAFSLGLTLVQSKLSVGAIIKATLLFSLTSPLGIIGGLLVNDLAEDSMAATLADGVLQGIACGTFIYIVFLEILPHEFSHSSDYPHRLLKLIFLVVGFSTIVAILFIHPG